MIINNEKYYVIFYNNVQLIENDQNKYKIFRIILKVVIFEREIKIILNVRVLHNLKFFNNKKKTSRFFFRAKISLRRLKKIQNVFLKNVVLIVFNKNNQFLIQTNFLKMRKSS